MNIYTNDEIKKAITEIKSTLGECIAMFQYTDIPEDLTSLVQNTMDHDPEITLYPPESIGSRKEDISFNNKSLFRLVSSWMRWMKKFEIPNVLHIDYREWKNTSGFFVGYKEDMKKIADEMKHNETLLKIFIEINIKLDKIVSIIDGVLVIKMCALILENIELQEKVSKCTESLKRLSEIIKKLDPHLVKSSIYLTNDIPFCGEQYKIPSFRFKFQLYINDICFQIKRCIQDTVFITTFFDGYTKEQIDAYEKENNYKSHDYYKPMKFKDEQEETEARKIEKEIKVELKIFLDNAYNLSIFCNEQLIQELKNYEIK